MAGQVRRVPRQALGATRSAHIVAIVLLVALRRLTVFVPGWRRLNTRRPDRSAHRTALRAEPEGLAIKATHELLKEQSMAGQAFKELGTHLESMNFKASGLDGRVEVVYDGSQRLKEVTIAEDALEGASGDREMLRQALLGALQEAHDRSNESTMGTKWQLYRDNRALLDAPLTQLGAGGTEEDPWGNITKTDDSLKMAEEIFLKFDADGDGYWNRKETSMVQMATEGTEMQEEAFTALIIAAAPDGGRKLTEEDMERGLSKEKVLELYTDATAQRQLGFVLNVYNDYAKIFGEQDGAEQAGSGDVPDPSNTAPAVD